MNAIASLTSRQLRSFGLTTAAIVAILFGILLPWLFSHAWPVWPWVVAAMLAGVGLAYPLALAPVYRLWMKFGYVMGFINTRLLLGVMFYFVITPIGILMRLFGWDPMQRRLGRGASYRVPSHQRDSNHFERPF